MANDSGDKWLRWISAWMVGGAIAAVAIVIQTDPALIRFNAESVFDLAGTLAPFIVVALLVERATEVVVSGIRLQDKVTLKNAGPSDAQLKQFKTDTRRLAFVISFIGSTALAAVGIRIISAFLADDAEFAMGNAQREIFLSLDVLVTGFVIAGGADGIHKFVSLGTNYLDRANANVTNEVRSE